MHVRQVFSRGQITLLQQQPHTLGGNFWQAMGKGWAVSRPVNLLKNFLAAGQISLSELQAGQKHLTENESGQSPEHHIAGPIVCSVAHASLRNPGRSIRSGSAPYQDALHE